MIESKSYQFLVGLPVLIHVSARGAVTFEVDLCEASEAVADEGAPIAVAAAIEKAAEGMENKMGKVIVAKCESTYMDAHCTLEGNHDGRHRMGNGPGSIGWPESATGTPVPRDYDNQSYDDDGNPLGCDVCLSKSCNNYSLCGGPQEEPDV